MLRKIHSKIIAYFLLLCIIIGTLPIMAIRSFAEDSNSNFQSENIEPIEYASLQIFCDHLTWRCNESNYMRYDGKNLKSVAESTGIVKDLISYGTNYDLDNKCEDLFKRYIYDYTIEKVYMNAETGFFAMSVKNPDKKQSVLVFAASNGFDNLVDKNAISTIVKSIVKIIFGTSATQNEAVQTLSATFAYCFGKDWGENDFPLYYDNNCGNQTKDAFAAYTDLRKRTEDDWAISTTGHSLGSSLAVLVSTRYNIKCVSFDSIPLLDVSYYRLTDEMSQNFEGYDKWQFVDYINEGDILAGLWEKQYKNYVLCHDRTGDLEWNLTLESVWPTYKNDLSFLAPTGLLEKLESGFTQIVNSLYSCGNAHHISTILSYSKENDEFSLTDYSSYSVSSRENWKKNMGVQTLEIVDETATPSRTSTRKFAKKVLETVTALTNKTNNGNFLILGKSTDDTLYGENSASCYDTIYAGDGNDAVYALAGNDVLIGNKGDDLLSGDYGNDTYIYWKGDGKDKIRDIGGKDTINLYGFTADDFVSVKDNDDNNTFDITVGGETIIEISKTRNDDSGDNNMDIVINYDDGNKKTVSAGDFLYSKELKQFTVSGSAVTEIFDTDGKLLMTLDSDEDIAILSSLGSFRTGFEPDGKTRTMTAELCGDYTLKITSKEFGMIDFKLEEQPSPNTHNTYSRNGIIVKNGSVITAKTDEYSILSDYDGKGNGLTLGLNKKTETEVKSIEMSKTSLQMNINEKTLLTAKVIPQEASIGNCTWSSSDPSVAMVDKNGNVTAVGGGKCEITAFFEDGVYAKCNVFVESKELYLNSNEEQMRFGKKVVLTATLATLESEDIIWSSSDESVATVSQSGEVTAKGIGTATIYAKTIENDYCDSCKITVYYTWWQKIIYAVFGWILPLLGL